MGMKARHVHRTTCFVQSSLIFFIIKSKMMDITRRNCALALPLPPPQKKMCFFIKLRCYCLIRLVFYLQETNQTQLEESL